MDQRYQVGQHAGIGLGQHSVAEIEDVARGAGIDGAASVVDDSPCGAFETDPGVLTDLVSLVHSL